MSENHKQGFWELADGIQMDLRAAEAKMVSLRSILAQMNIPEAPTSVCEFCGPMPFGPRKLAEHMHTSHGHPHPDDPPAEIPAEAAAA